MSKKLITILIAFFIALNSFSQLTTDQKEIFNNGVFFFEYEDYKEALYNFLQLYMSDQQNANINYKIAMCYINISGWESKSIPYFLRASNQISYDYNEYSFSEVNAPLHTLFYLSKAYRMNNKLDKAKETIDEFINSEYYADYNPEIVERELEKIKIAQILQESPVNISTAIVDEPISDKYDNYRAVISGNGNHMVFVSTFKLYEAVMYSNKINDKWQKPINISSILGSDGNLFPVSLSHDGKKLFLVKDNNSDNTDIYISNYTSSWGKAVPFTPINTKGNETHACISADGLHVYFTSDRRSNGGLDIFKITYNEKKEEWGKIENLGREINSEYDEDAPYILSDGITLFFSSKGHYNMGGYDVFKSQQGKKAWSEPVNLGYPINTTIDNLHYVPFENGKKALISKQPEGGIGDIDIYTITINE